ncbi:BREX-3 system P-loop-containing protein BrxF [Anaerocellum danielii]|uniref:BREX-3 system P-loop-containing protein BrxF n=1 Tax=Anaerocellum danielii TaxID=1387557 RepID=A0ABZ0U329_9FIRM|nr:BREX-3 system P-loop-containing protein BrxF [Caldicellulosiruptor danielii]WPX10121.1 BREX-3 system P-loop-containing protein BrxF [Caldicellulosiruptor danielii]
MLGELDKYYYKLALIISENPSQTSKILKELSTTFGIRYINLNLELANYLVEIPFSERWLHVSKAIDEIILKNEDQSLVIDNTDILFEEHLKIDPVGVLKNASKYKKLIASLRARIENNYIIYANPQAKEYKKYKIDNLECYVINLQE